MEELRLNSTDSVFAVDKEKTLPIELQHTTKKFPLTDVHKVIDQYEVYQRESSACNTYRLTLTVKPYCTNVLFNTCTEIVANEGGEGRDVEVASDASGKELTINNNRIKGKKQGIKRADMVEDTEYSSEEFGFEYHPGYDIFGNHNLRNLSFRSVIPLKNPSPSQREIYNTISDLMRDTEGKTIKIDPRTFSATNVTTTRFIEKHLYEKTNLLSTEESVNINLTNVNGWYGFYNNSSIQQKLFNGDMQEFDGNHVINNRGNCEFVDMYPDRTLYSFTPKLNAYKRRMEKNWDVFITYPYKNFYNHNLVTNISWYDVESQQTNVKDIQGDGKTNALLLMEAISQKCKNGMEGVQFRSYCKHNLSENDYVNIYYSFDGGATFNRCKTSFWVNYIGDMQSENKDYFFALTNTSVLDEIFERRIEEYFYDETQYLHQPSRVINGHMTEIPQDLDTEDLSFVPNIVVYYYKLAQTLPYVQWNENNTVTEIPQDVENGETYIRQRRQVNGEFVYDYYQYQNGAYQQLYSESLSGEFGDGNTFDDMPVGYVTDYIRIHSYDYYERSHKYYTQKTEKVSSIVNNLLCNYIQLRFAKVSNNHECKYYIRLFKKLPNLNYRKSDLTNAIARNVGEMDEYIANNATKNGKMRDFNAEIYPLAFSNTIYGDGITQYQFTENMDIAYIRDNLGRPLTEIYTTIVKKNVGYKDWYGTDKHFSDYKDNEGNVHRVEYSHCFGKVTSGLEFLSLKTDDSDFYRLNKGFLSDATQITNVKTALMQGKPLEFWGDVNMVSTQSEETEGILEDDEVFFGDVVEFNPMTVTETTLSDVQFRFNTAQRENGSTSDYVFTYREIDSDDYDISANGFQTKKYENERDILCPEGYYYKAHYPMGVRSFSNYVRQGSHYSVLVKEAKPIQMEGIFIRVETKNNHGYSAGRKIFICNDENKIWYNSVIVSIDSKTSFIIKPIEKTVEAYEGKPYLDWVQTCTLINSQQLRLRASNDTIPDYAYNAGTNLFLWREIIAAPQSDDETISQYPFANGALYIDRDINFYLKRQDPEATSGLYYYTGIFPDPEGKIQELSNYVYITEHETTC